MFYEILLITFAENCQDTQNQGQGDLVLSGIGKKNLEQNSALKSHFGSSSKLFGQEQKIFGPKLYLDQTKVYCPVLLLVQNNLDNVQKISLLSNFFCDIIK